MNKYATPQEVSDVELAFPTSVSELMPPYSEVPEEFKQHGGTKWNNLVSDWFFSGLKSFEPSWKEGIDPDKAMRHIGYVLGSFEPKHEHKEAGVAYLFSLWADDVKWERGK